MFGSGMLLGACRWSNLAKVFIVMEFWFDLLPQVVHVVSAQQQGSELLHERPNLPCGRHPFCKEYFFTSEGEGAL